MMLCMVFSLEWCNWNENDCDGGSGTFTGMMSLEGGVTFRATILSAITSLPCQLILLLACLQLKDPFQYSSIRLAITYFPQS